MDVMKRIAAVLILIGIGIWLVASFISGESGGSEDAPQFETTELELHAVRLEGESTLAIQIASEVWVEEEYLSYGMMIPRQTETSYVDDRLRITVLDQIHTSGEGYVYVDTEWLEQPGPREVDVIIDGEVNRFVIAYSGYTARIENADTTNLRFGSRRTVRILPSDVGVLTGYDTQGLTGASGPRFMQAAHRVAALNNLTLAHEKYPLINQTYVSDVERGRFPDSRLYVLIDPSQDTELVDAENGIRIRLRIPGTPVES